MGVTDHSVVVQQMAWKHDRLFNDFQDGLYGEVFSFVITGVYRGKMACQCGKYRDTSGDPWEDHAVIFVLRLHLSVPLI